jgi:hypothetical protein
VRAGWSVGRFLEGRLGFVLQFSGAELQEELQGPVVHAAEAGLVTVDEPEGALVIGEGLEGEGDAAGVVDEVVVPLDPFLLIHHLQVEHGGFDFPEAALPPAGGDHLEDEILFDFALWGELYLIVIQERIEFFPGLIGEDEEVGRGKAVFEGVFGGFLFTLRRFGAAGLGAIGAGGLDLFLGWHRAPWIVYGVRARVCGGGGEAGRLESGSWGVGEGGEWGFGGSELAGIIRPGVRGPPGANLTCCSQVL